MDDNLIYGLRDPRNDLYYYIGKTTIGKNRPITHLHYSHNKDVRKWILELKDINLEPYIDIIESDINISDLNNREKYWINEYKKTNENIFNINLIDKKLYCLSEFDWNKLEIINEVLSNLPLLIKSIRLKYDLTQREVAKLCGVSLLTMAKLERYNSQHITLSSIIKLINLNPENIIRNHRNIRIKR